MQLKELSVIGCGFIPNNLIKETHSKSLVSGTFFCMNSRYPAVAAVYKNGRPPVLYDILGENKAAAKSNKKKVKGYIKLCRKNNTNGYGTLIHKRRTFLLFKGIVTFAIFLTCAYCVYLMLANSFQLKYVIGTIFSFIVEFICFVTNRITRERDWRQ